MIEFKVNQKLVLANSPLTQEEYEALRISIDIKGQLEPIEVMADGTIIDGHHRYRICIELNKEPKYIIKEDIKTIDEALDYLFEISLRRNKTTFQKAETAYRIRYPKIKSESVIGRPNKVLDSRTLIGGVDKVVAKQVGISSSTFYKARKIFEAYDERKLPECSGHP